jgi:hypothetical protein
MSFDVSSTSPIVQDILRTPVPPPESIWVEQMFDTDYLRAFRRQGVAVYLEQRKGWSPRNRLMALGKPSPQCRVVRTIQHQSGVPLPPGLEDADLWYLISFLYEFGLHPPSNVTAQGAIRVGSLYYRSYWRAGAIHLALDAGQHQRNYDAHCPARLVIAHA